MKVLSVLILTKKKLFLILSYKFILFPNEKKKKISSIFISSHIPIIMIVGCIWMCVCVFWFIENFCVYSRLKIIITPFDEKWCQILWEKIIKTFCNNKILLIFLIIKGNKIIIQDAWYRLNILYIFLCYNNRYKKMMRTQQVKVVKM